MNRQELEQFGEDVLRLFTSHSITVRYYAMGIELNPDYYQTIQSNFLVTPADWERLLHRSNPSSGLTFPDIGESDQYVIPAVFDKLWQIVLSPFCFPNLNEPIEITEMSNLGDSNNRDISEQLIKQIGNEIWQRFEKMSVELCRYYVTIDITQADYLAWKDHFSVLLPRSRPNGFVVKGVNWEITLRVGKW